MTLRSSFLGARRFTPAWVAMLLALGAPHALAQAEYGGPVDPTFVMERVLEVVPETERKGLRLAFIPENTSKDAAAEMLKNALNTRDFEGVLAIGGPDPKLTELVTVSAFEEVYRDLVGLKVVFVGEEASRPLVHEAVGKTGAEFIFAPM